MRIITLTTDFGLQDGYAGVVKGVIWQICPEARIVDLSHSVPPQNVPEGARLMVRAAPFFPPGTVHIGVVDPGVGTARRPLAAQLGDCFFVGPDNGLLTLLHHRAQEKNDPVVVVHLTRPRFWLPRVSNVFHGRDIFAPVGAAIANDVPLTDLGDVITDPILLDLPQPVHSLRGWVGQVIHVDHFGNLSTNIESRHLSEGGMIRVRLGDVVVEGLARTFGDGDPGDFVALLDSSDCLTICLVNGNASQRLGVGVGAEVILEQVE